MKQLTTSKDIAKHIINISSVTELAVSLQISSDAGVVSDVSKEIDSLVSNGNNNVRVFQFVHVTQIGCDRTPELHPWQRLFNNFSKNLL